MSQRVFESMLNKTATITSVTTGEPNSFGETDTSEETVGSIKIALQPLRETYSITRAGREYVVTIVGYILFNQDIEAGDYITVDSKKYLVVGIEDMGGRGKYQKLLLTEV
ncbi:MAG: hypothetical protein DRP74_09360 [Candidatus Omnitrophota bacterium]|nr:MAG: hypothetical protein DRP74_09360 [Candidatus Omnitrophota bacterium]